ncbi:hypothetical protein AAVH_38461 [Aphelenchoides avenae]|nr:hypothetical protein AAVH_38461 [Aphelenchus avenae]
MEHTQLTNVLNTQQTDVQSSKWMDKWKSSLGILQQKPVKVLDSVIIQQCSVVKEAKHAPESQQEPSWFTQPVDGAKLPEVIEATTPQRSRSPSESSGVSCVPSTVLTTISEETLEDVAVRAETPPGSVIIPPTLIQKANVTLLPAWMLKWMSNARKSELDWVFESP